MIFDKAHEKSQGIVESLLYMHRRRGNLGDRCSTAGYVLMFREAPIKFWLVKKVTALDSGGGTDRNLLRS